MSPLCVVCQQPLGHDNRVVWANGVRHHLRCPPAPRETRQNCDTARRASLQKAQQSRTERCAIKAAITAGSVTLGEAMLEPCMASMSVYALLAQQHYWGPQRVKRVLSQLQISPLRNVRELTDRQRELLVVSVAKAATKGGT